MARYFSLLKSQSNRKAQTDRLSVPWNFTYTKYPLNNNEFCNLLFFFDITQVCSYIQFIFIKSKWKQKHVASSRGLALKNNVWLVFQTLMQGY